MKAFEVLSLFTMTVSPTLRSLGFMYIFLSAYCFIVLLALVSRSSAMGVIRCGRCFFMVRPNRIVAGGAPVVQCGVVRYSSRNYLNSCFQLRSLFRAVLMDFFTVRMKRSVSVLAWGHRGVILLGLNPVIEA